MDVAEKGLQLKQDFDDVYEAGKSAGTNLPISVAEMNGGTWTQATTIGGAPLDIQHGLTDEPDAIIITSDIFEIAPTEYCLGYMFYEKDAQSFGYSVYRDNEITTRVNYNTLDTSGRQGITSVDNNKFTISTANNRKLPTGVTYSWIAIRWVK